MQQNYNGGLTTTSNRDATIVHRHRLARLVLSSLLLGSAIILLGLTAARIHWTRTFLGGSESIVVELLVTSILTIIASTLLFMRKTIELGYLGLIWLMSIVGASIASNDFDTELCGRFAFNQCGVLQAIQAFSWIVFGLITVLIVLRLINWRRDSDTTGTGGYHGKHTGGLPATGPGATV
ncbi:hypothetical protein GALMADRAFT_216521 [Galerina marginata CBS 339.88]|uniref:MARVEL domain-containing protein n=1 Tax=Galerina marginata (strain CBS 339.88) TaxID=685588 RepID=A0A067SBZ4_GALM3|nr:hypothetical protein GALMADRAFT_216521 [Galerina marginata CBS 339.88]